MMNMNNLIYIGIIVVVFFVFLALILSVMKKLYIKTTKGKAYVRTGFGGEKIIKDGGTFVLPIIQNLTPVNMNTIKLEVSNSNETALVTKDYLRVDISTEFYLRVKQDKEAISIAAQTLGEKTLEPKELRDLVLGKFTAALRSVAASMTIEELHEKRVEFVQAVQTALNDELNKNGLELETVSLTKLDQSSFENFKEDNAFDAKGKAVAIKVIEEKKKETNEIIQTNKIEIFKRNQITYQEENKIKIEKEQLDLDTNKRIAFLNAEQKAEIEKEEAIKRQIGEEAKINTDREIEKTRIKSNQEIEEHIIQSKKEIEVKEIERKKEIEAREIAKTKSIELEEIEKEKSIEIANQQKQIEIADKSSEEFKAKTLAEKERAETIKATEEVETNRLVAITQREKEVQLIKTQEMVDTAKYKDEVNARVRVFVETQEAEALKIKTNALYDSEKMKTDIKAYEISKTADANKEAKQVEADSNAYAINKIAEANRTQYEVEAKGKESLINAENQLSHEMIQMKLQELLIKALPEIIAQSVKPIESIKDVKMMDFGGNGLNGLNNLSGNSVDGNDNNGGDGIDNLPNKFVKSALKYRAYSPLVDNILSNFNINNVNSLVDGSYLNNMLNVKNDTNENDVEIV